MPTQEARDAAITIGTAAGLVLEYSNAYLLLLDLDSYQMRVKSEDLITRFRQHINITHVEARQSTSGPGHWHYFAHLGTPMGPEDRIFWQAALGSDRVREALNYLWIRNKGKSPDFLLSDHSNTLRTHIDWREP